MEFGEDYDTSAIVWGLSGAATRLGLCAAKSIEDFWVYKNGFNFLAWHKPT